MPSTKDLTGFVCVGGALERSLENVDLDIPRDALVVLTGVSGSGKSSVVFGTLAEAQRRYLEVAEEDLRGYGIMRQVAEQTGGGMRLLEEKFIEEVELRDGARSGESRRRYYRLTPAGRKLARSEADRLADLLRFARAKKIFRGEYV